MIKPNFSFTSISLTSFLSPRFGCYKGFCLSQAKMSSAPNDISATKAVFDNKLTDVYGYFAKQHFHPNGPFNKITTKVIDILSNCSDKSPIVVDLASGPGEPASSIAKSLPFVSVYSTDISEAMHKIALEQSNDIPNLYVKIADMQDLKSLFEENSVDVVTCCYGFMFPPDKMKSLQETLRILKPGGTLIATTWNKIGHMEFYEDVFSHVLGEKYTARPSFDPLSLSEPGLFEKMLEEAGFEKESIITLDDKYPMDLSNDSEFHLATALATDVEKKLDSVPHERILSVFYELAPKYVEIQDNGTIVSKENIYKTTVAKKKMVT